MKKIILIIAILLIASTTHADEFWSITNATKNINQQYAISLEEELHFNDGLNFSLTALGMGYKVNDWMKIKGEYTYIRSEGSGNWTTEHRPRFNIIMNWKNLENRSRFEYRIRKDQENTWRYRNRLKITVPIGPVKAYVADEGFFDLDRGEFVCNWVIGGMKVPISSWLSAEGFYFRQRARSGDSWKSSNVVGVSLSLCR